MKELSKNINTNSNTISSVYIVSHKGFGGETIYKVSRTEQEAENYIKNEHPKDAYHKSNELDITKWDLL
jgi:hypothetical protein